MALVQDGVEFVRARERLRYDELLVLLSDNIYVIILPESVRCLKSCTTLKGITGLSETL